MVVTCSFESVCQTLQHTFAVVYTTHARTVVVPRALVVVVLATLIGRDDGDEPEW